MPPLTPLYTSYSAPTNTSRLHFSVPRPTRRPPFLKKRTLYTKSPQLHFLVSSACLYLWWIFLLLYAGFRKASSFSFNGVGSVCADWLSDWDRIRFPLPKQPEKRVIVNTCRSSYGYTLTQAFQDSWMTVPSGWSDENINNRSLFYSVVLWCTQTHCALQHSPKFSKFRKHNYDN